MIIKWIIIGLLLFAISPLDSQTIRIPAIRFDSLFHALDTSKSNYQIPHIADQLLQLIDTTQSTAKLYKIYRQKGISHAKSGFYGKALIAQQSANRIAYELQDSFRIAQSTYSIGNIQRNLNLVDSARKQYQEAVDIFSRLDSMRWVAFVHNAYGILESKEENWDAALSYYRQAFNILTDNGLGHIASVPLNNIGDVYLNQKKYELSLQSFRKGLDLALQQDRINDVAVAHFNIGESWCNLGKFNPALQEIRYGLFLARTNGFKRVEASGLKLLSETFEKMQLQDSALFYLQAYLQLQDSLQAEENKIQIEELNVAYETEKARLEIKARQKEIQTLKQQKRLDALTGYFIISLLILALMISSFFFVRSRMKRKLTEIELRNQKLESDQMRKELEGKQKDLTNLALEIARKNELFTKTNQALKDIQKIDLPKNKHKQIKHLIQYNNQQLRINEDLEELQLNIEQVNTGFFEKLAQIAPDLTTSERQLCSLLRLNLGTKEIASIRNISPKSVEMARYRLRKKLPLNTNDDIYAFVQRI